jgi:hypothetical protein
MSGTPNFFSPDFVRTFIEKHPRSRHTIIPKDDPEACIDQLNDQWGYGLTLYALITGNNSLPWKVRDPRTYLYQLSKVEFTNKDLDFYLKEISDGHPLKPLLRKIFLGKKLKKPADLINCKERIVVDIVGFFENENKLVEKYNLKID